MVFPKGIRKADKPSMSNIAGRFWETCVVTLLDGSTTQGFYETTRGQRFYFQHGADWYRGSIDDFDRGAPGTRVAPDLRRAKR